MSIFFDLSFWQNLVSNALATLLGVIAGIPVALLISRQLEKASEKEHKKKILQLLQHELFMNLSALNRWNNPNEHTLTRCTNLEVFLQTGHWDAFSDGGELQWIKDPSLLGQIAEGYNFVRMMLTLSRRFSQLLQVYQFDKDSQAITDAEDLLHKGVPEAFVEIQHALHAIDDARKQLGDYPVKTKKEE